MLPAPVQLPFLLRITVRYGLKLIKKWTKKCFHEIEEKCYFSILASVTYRLFQSNDNMTFRRYESQEFIHNMSTGKKKHLIFSALVACCVISVRRLRIALLWRARRPLPRWLLMMRGLIIIPAAVARGWRTATVA